MTDENKAPDWEQIELDYRANIKSLRLIASEQNISDTAIRKRAKKENWPRDLKAKINAKAEQLVRAEVVRGEVRTKTTITEKETIDANANVVATIRIDHRKDISRARSMTMQLFDEPEHMIGVENVDLLQQLGELLYSPNAKGEDKLNDLYMKIIQLPNRVKAMKELSDTLKTLVGLERQAYGLEEKENTTVDALTSLLTKITSGNDSAFMPVQDDKDYEE